MKLKLQKVTCIHTPTWGEFAGIPRAFVPFKHHDGCFLVYDGGNKNEDLLETRPDNLDDLWKLMQLSFGVRMKAQDERGDASILVATQKDKRIELVYETAD